MSDAQTEMPLAATYEIRSVEDFGAIPKDRIRACLKEFAIALEMQAATADLLNAVAQELHGVKDGIAVRMDVFRWIDDDAGTIEISIQTPDGGESTPRSGRSPTRGEESNG